MDDIKKELYLYADRLLRKDFYKEEPLYTDVDDLLSTADYTKYLCIALKRAYYEILGSRKILLEDELIEMFSEFYEMFDNKYYSPFFEGGEYISDDLKNIHPWWHSSLKEPRHRIIHFLLENR